MTDVLSLLQEFRGEKLALLLRHEVGARQMAQYDVNNTYQYIVNREEVQVSWLSTAIAELGGAVTDPSATPGPPPGRGADAVRRTLEEDVAGAQAFVDRWRPRVEAMDNARHAKMLRLILGETLEQKRFFEQALAGRTDLLGRRAAQQDAARGEVLSSRWIE
ncbi:MAG: hypothetical protein ABUS56_13735 [Acidobacteriota bacterium]